MNPLFKCAKMFSRIAVLLFLFTSVQIYAITAKFSVDMTKQVNTGKFNITSDKVYLRGSFNNWEQNAEMIKDPTGYIYSVSIQVEPFTYYEYKYFITSAGASNGGYEDSVGAAHGNRYFNFLRFNTILPVDFFNNEEPFSDNITITSPAAGEYREAGSSHNIMWNATGITNVKIEYTSNRGDTWETIVSSVPASNGSYHWLVPDIVSYEWKIRISDAENPADVEYSTGLMVTYADIASSVPPLLKVEYPVFNWPLNAYYPPTTAVDGENINGKVGNACGPTAMTNIMRFWEYPRKGTNTRSFTDYLGCAWSADFAGTVYDYDRMPKKIPYDAPDSVYKEVATLMYHAGVGMHSMWRSGGQDGVLEAFHEYFNYSKKSKFIERDYYTPQQWEKVVKSELSAGRPLITASLNHWFIVDGYNEDNLFHVKWDYGEESDEYLPLYRSGDAEKRNWILAYLEPELNGRQLQLTLPAGDENWQQGSQQTITWNSTNVSTIKIEYSINSGYNWVTLASNVPAGTGSYNILIPPGMSDDCKIRITDESDINIYSKNNTSFYVYETKSLSLLSPTDAVYFQSGSKAAIVWSASGLTKVDIEYKIGETGSWIKIAQALDAGAKTFKWLIPEINSDYVKVRVIESGGQFYSESNSYFRIGSDWEFGSPYAKDDNTVLLLHFDNDIADDAAGAICSSTGKEKMFPLSGITGLGNSIRFDNTEQTPTYISFPSSNLLRLPGSWTIDFWFYISSWDKSFNNWPVPFIKDNSGGASNYFLEIPASEKRFKFGFRGNTGDVVFYSDQNIVSSGAWYHIALVNDYSGKKLKLILHNSNKEKIYESSLSYPSGTTIQTGDGELRIGDGFAGDNQFDGLIDEFRISNIAREFRSLLLSSLNGGEKLLAGEQFNITWSSRDIFKIKLEYTTNNGTTWTQFANNVNAKPGSYNWIVPSVTSANCKLRISDQADPNYFFISNGTFSITQLPSITLTQPNGGENWPVESNQNITWSSINVDAVKLEYTTDDGANWILITDSTSALLNYSWKIPNTPSNQCKVKISSLSDPSLNDISNNTFKISGPAFVNLIKPNGGERLYSGSQYEITWHGQEISNVRIKYSTDNGAAWILVTTANAATEKYLWTIPNIFSRSCRVQISSTTIAGAVDESDAVFTISPVPSILITSPNGGEKYIQGTTQQITWSSNYVDSIKIEYCTNGGADWKIISEGIPADSGKINWIIPAQTSNNCFVKITDAADTSISDISNANFTIDILSDADRWNSGIPDKFELYQNYPNPFNPATRIRYAVPATSFIRLSVYDLLGNEIKILANEVKNAGYYEIDLHVNNLGAGIYFLKIEAGNYSSIKKMLLLK